MAQLSAGTAFKFGTMTSADQAPTQWTHIPDITEVPGLDGDVESLDSTTLDNKEYKTSVPGLKDPGGVKEVTAYDTPEFREAWGAFVEATNSQYGAAACIEIPAPISKRIWFKAAAVPYRFAGASTGALIPAAGRFSMLGEPDEEDLV